MRRAALSLRLRVLERDVSNLNVPPGVDLVFLDHPEIQASHPIRGFENRINVLFVRGQDGRPERCGDENRS